MSDSTKDITLAPCPFCGADAKPWRFKTKDYVECSGKSCPISGIMIYKKEWNIRTSPESQLVGLDEKAMYNLLMNEFAKAREKGLTNLFIHCDAADYVAKSICAKFGSPQKETMGGFPIDKSGVKPEQKESGDLEKVLEEFDRLTDVEKCQPEESLLVTENYKEKQDFLNYPESEYEICHEKLKSFIRTHWPKSDPRFVEVEKIEWPLEISTFDMPIGCNHDKKKSWNKAIVACKVAVEKAITERKSNG